jgi:cytochrome c oxidase subunit IV
MRTAGRILAGIALFLALTGGVYWFTSYEQAGTVLLLAGAGFAAMVAGALLRWAGSPAPEDRQDADMAEGAGELGWFPTASIWPAGTGAGAGLLALGLAFGVWLALVGAALFVASVLGYALADRRPAGRGGRTQPRHSREDAST